MGKRMKRHHAPPSLNKIVHANLLQWILTPSLCFILLLGIYLAYERNKDFDTNNSILAVSVAKSITLHVYNAQTAVNALSQSIIKYDPFWYSWILGNFLQSNPDFERIVYLTSKGKILAASPQANDFAALNLFQGSISDKPSIMFKPVPSTTTGNLVVHIGMKLKSGNILIGELNLNMLQKRLAGLIPQDHGELVLCDGYGNLIIHPDSRRVMEQDNIGNLSIIQDYRKASPWTTVYRNDDQLFLGTISRVPETAWLILISQPAFTVYFPLISSIVALLGTAAVLFLIFARYLQFRLRRNVITPLSNVTKSMHMVARGEYDHPFPQTNKFLELAVIEQEFDAMTRNIQLREQEISENEERFRQLVESIHEVFWIQDFATDRILYASPSFEQIWGVPREKLLDGGLEILSTQMATDRKRVDSAREALRSQGIVFNEEYRILKPDGSTKWIRAQAYPVYDDVGTKVRLVGVAEDITRRKNVESSLHEAKVAAESANTAKTEFLTNMSHELRTPLNGILGMLQLVKKNKLDEEQAEYVDTAISSSKVLLNVINDILNISQIEAGKMVLHEKLFSPEELLETLYRFFKHSTEGSEIELSIDIGPNFPKLLKGDDVRIRQILFNLVGNAVKFTDSGKVSVSASALPMLEGSNKVRLLFEVQDTGIGIPSDKIDFVFESFTQVDGTYTRAYQGTGLGLGIVKKLVQLMNGTIAVESEEGCGTSVHFTLELEKPHPETANPKQKDAIPVLKPFSQKILVAEDDRINQIAITKMLEKLGHRAECAGNGQEAVEAVQKNEYACVFMDIQMPGMDGIEAMKHIRELGPPQSEIPIVALTAHAMPEDRKRFLAMGMSDYLPKPVSIEELTAASATAELQTVIRITTWSRRWEGKRIPHADWRPCLRLWCWEETAWHWHSPRLSCVAPKCRNVPERNAGRQQRGQPKVPSSNGTCRVQAFPHRCAHGSPC